MDTPPLIPEALSVCSVWGGVFVLAPLQGIKTPPANFVKICVDSMCPKS